MKFIGTLENLDEPEVDLVYEETQNVGLVKVSQLDSLTKRT